MKFRLEQDISVEELLHQTNQPTELIEQLWEPLCVAALNTPIRQASAQVFITVLQKSFTGSRRNSDLLLPRKHLGKIIPEPAMDFIERRGGTVELGTRVKSLLFTDSGIEGVETRKGMFPADHVIVATSFQEAVRLLNPHPAFRSLVEKMGQLESEPIDTLYVQYPEHVRLTREMLAVQGGFSQWVFDRRIYQQDGLVSVVISANGEHTQMEKQQLTERILQELNQLFPGLPSPIDCFLIREKRATFSCRSGSDDLRPASRTPVPGCWLAGDYTQTNLPATLEGAILSGVQCAEQLIESLRTARR